ncbi:DNA-3-methyladenine glycosylase [bacterium]|nr:DNA-3-methyladenine glycosylase [bacterium]NIN92989.1 DNA-3-methyladenine glycosylase [bacterium]NIO19053.1 DNA-3-methyladenine glycosylase [bacterium]NIO74181.1 DNA-3-methyladenine glycosylase [bacterium]
MSRKFYSRKTIVVAKELLGKTLVHKTDEGIISGKIVETEAYLGQKDPGSHAYGGITRRNRIMFGPAGKAYIYLVYGNHYCLNVVTEKDGVSGAVLIRALEPQQGIGLMRKRRRLDGPLPRLANGPGKLTKALGITGSMNGADLTGNRLFIISQIGSPRKKSRCNDFSIVTTGRIGITTGQNLPYRYYIKGSRFVSKTVPIRRQECG